MIKLDDIKDAQFFTIYADETEDSSYWQKTKFFDILKLEN